MCRNAAGQAGAKDSAIDGLPIASVHLWEALARVFRRVYSVAREPDCDKRRVLVIRLEPCAFFLEDEAVAIAVRCLEAEDQPVILEFRVRP